MIRPCTAGDFDRILEIINRAAEAYRGVIPPDRWHEPYMPASELDDEMSAGVVFAGWQADTILQGVMGCQDVRDVTLIRHAYVEPACQRQGIGGALLRHWLAAAERPVLLGTWKAARWAVNFYLGQDFTLLEGEEKNRLLQTYWSIPARQVETSVVLADPRWMDQNRHRGI